MMNIKKIIVLALSSFAVYPAFTQKDVSFSMSDFLFEYKNTQHEANQVRKDYLKQRKPYKKVIDFNGTKVPLLIIPHYLSFNFNARAEGNTKILQHSDFQGKGLKVKIIYDFWKEIIETMGGYSVSYSLTRFGGFQIKYKTDNQHIIQDLGDEFIGIPNDFYSERAKFIFKNLKNSNITPVALVYVLGETKEDEPKVYLYYKTKYNKNPKKQNKIRMLKWDKLFDNTDQMRAKISPHIDNFYIDDYFIVYFGRQKLEVTDRLISLKERMVKKKRRDEELKKELRDHNVIDAYWAVNGCQLKVYSLKVLKQ